MESGIPVLKIQTLWHSALPHTDWKKQYFVVDTYIILREYRKHGTIINKQTWPTWKRAWLWQTSGNIYRSRLLNLNTNMVSNFQFKHNFIYCTLLNLKRRLHYNCSKESCTGRSYTFSRQYSFTHCNNDLY